MKRLTISILFISLIVFGNTILGIESVRSNDSAYPAEELMVHFTQKCVFPGEVIWFKVYCTSPLYPETELSRIAYIELINSENSSLIRKKILLEGGEGKGEFIIPDKMQTGVYHILAYTNWMKNFGENSFFKSSIVVINPDEEFEYLENDSISNNETEIIQKIQKSGVDGIKVSSDKKEYSTREKVIVTIDGDKLYGGKYSVSVCKKVPVLYAGGDFFNQNEELSQPVTIQFLPDYKGIRLTGNLTDASGIPVVGGQVVLSFPGQGTDANSTNTDLQGNFHFLLEPGEGQKDLVLTLPQPNLKLKLEESFWNGFKLEPTKALLSFDKNAVSFLTEKYAHLQLQKKFKQQFFENITMAQDTEKGKWCFYGNPDQVIKMSDYITLDSLTEYFWELIPSVKFVQRKGSFIISIIDPVTYLPFQNAPGVFVDGVLYKDYDEIADIPVEDVQQISIIAKTYYYRDLTFGGIVDIHTKKSDFNAVKILLDMARVMYPLGNLSESALIVSDYSESKPISSLPDLRYLLYWNPEIELNENNKSIIEFFTSDIEGDYLINICGLNQEGEIVKEQLGFVVKASTL